MSVLKTNEIKDLDNNVLLNKDGSFKSVATVKDLPKGAPGLSVVVQDEDHGGVFVWDEGTAKTGHNGGTIIDPLVDMSTWTYESNNTGQGVWKRQYEGAVNVKWFGAKGDEATDDTKALQKVLDLFSNIFLPSGVYLISRNSSVDGHINYGLAIRKGDVTLKGVLGKTFLKRANSIDSYENAYPHLHIGNVEYTSPATISDVSVESIRFLGNNTRHDVSGNALSDLRTAVQVSAVINLTIRDCVFDSIDSSAILFVPPRYYSYKSSTTLNTHRYNEVCKIESCTFYGNAHTEYSRAFMHALMISGVNSLLVSNCLFSWCDAAISGQGTYDIEGVDGARYSSTFHSNGEDYLRCGREWVIANNVFRNSTEHTVYLTGNEISFTGNTINVDSEVVSSGDIKVRGQHVSITGNTVVAGKVAMQLGEYSRDVTVTGNVLSAKGGTSWGVITIENTNIKQYIDNRPWYDTSNGYSETANIVIANNVIKHHVDISTIQKGAGIFIYTDLVLPEGFTDCTMRNIVIQGNTIENVKIGIDVSSRFAQDVVIDSNTITGAVIPFSSNTNISDIPSTCAISVPDNYPYMLLGGRYFIRNNNFRYFKYIFAILKNDGSLGGGQSDVYYRPPFVFSTNFFKYCGDLYQDYGEGYWYAMSVGSYAGNMAIDCIGQTDDKIIRGLWHVGNRLTTYTLGYNGLKNSNFAWTGSDLLYYYDNDGNYKVLNN